MNFKYKTEPWEHQKAALEYLYTRDLGALYTEPGTGKTKVIIDLIVNRGFKRTLIVCTNKGCEVWEKQFKIHANIDDFYVQNLAGKSSSVKVSTLTSKANLNNKPEVFICNYEGVWRNEVAKVLLRKSFLIDCVVCDESHRIKSPGSKVSRFLFNLSKKVPCRYLVTGTPAAESPMDVYAQYRFLDSTIFGTNFGAFKDRYQNLDVQKSLRVGFPILDEKQPYKNLEELREKMFSCAFYAKSTITLPKQMNLVVKYSLSSKAWKIYQQLQSEKATICKQGFLEVDNILNLSLRKQQIASGFLKIEDDNKNHKIVRIDDTRICVLEELLEQFSPDTPIVIFAQFRRDLRQIRGLCDKLHRGYSEISGTENTQEDWDNGKTSIIGVQYSSGSESIDLTRARYCIYYSLTQSLALYEQSKKRIHRPGQTRPVTYYHICSTIKKGKSVDEQILHALRRKQDVAEYLIKANTLSD